MAEALNLDSFEMAIVCDWARELEGGQTHIAALPIEFGGAVREDLVRLHAWFLSEDSPILLILAQGTDTKKLERIIQYVDQYAEYQSVLVLDITSNRFEDDFLIALERDPMKLVIVIPFEKFSKIETSGSTIEVIQAPRDDVAWANYAYLAEWLDVDSLWPTITYSQTGHHALSLYSTSHVALALARDRLVYREK